MTASEGRTGQPDAHPDAKQAQAATQDAKAKQEAQEAEREARQAAREAEAEADKAADRAAESQDAAAEPDEAPDGDADAKEDDAAEDEAPEVEEVPEEDVYRVKAKPELSPELAAALAARAAKNAKRPAFRRQEWFRYRKLGGKDAPWRRPRGIHSKMRRHFKYRPPVVSVGYRGPAAARGLHPSGFEEVLVHRPEDLLPVDPKVQAVRIGGTVGGRKAEAITNKADELGIRVLNRRQ